jgi:hypothetical protein
MSNDEEAVVLYAKVISVLASCYVLPAEVLTKVAQRLQVAGAIHPDRIDKAALATLAAVLISYIDEDEEAA